MNKDKVQNQNILGTLVNKDESGIIAYSDQIYDKKADKSLEEENIKQNERLDNAEAKDRELQSTLENITKTGEASAASNVTYNHNDSKLDATNVQQAVDEISTKTVFDISDYHATGGTLATYDNLEDALGTNGKNIPQSLRKGGMSVKYVHTSDNKYVQARLMADSFTTDVTQWQGVDDEPTAGSVNLVKSGGVFDSQTLLKTVNNLLAPHKSGAFVKIENSDDLTRGKYKISIFANGWTTTISGASNTIVSAYSKEIAGGFLYGDWYMIFYDRVNSEFYKVTYRALTQNSIRHSSDIFIMAVESFSGGDITTFNYVNSPIVDYLGKLYYTFNSHIDNWLSEEELKSDELCFTNTLLMPYTNTSFVKIENSDDLTKGKYKISIFNNAWFVTLNGSRNTTASFYSKDFSISEGWFQIFYDVKQNEFYAVSYIGFKNSDIRNPTDLFVCSANYRDNDISHFTYVNAPVVNYLGDDYYTFNSDFSHWVKVSDFSQWVKVSDLTLDNIVTKDSNNGVKSGAVYAELLNYKGINTLLAKYDSTPFIKIENSDNDKKPGHKITLYNSGWATTIHGSRRDSIVGYSSDFAKPEGWYHIFYDFINSEFYSVDYNRFTESSVRHNTDLFVCSADYKSGDIVRFTYVNAPVVNYLGDDYYTFNSDFSHWVKVSDFSQWVKVSPEHYKGINTLLSLYSSTPFIKIENSDDATKGLYKITLYNNAWVVTTKGSRNTSVSCYSKDFSAHDDWRHIFYDFDNGEFYSVSYRDFTQSSIRHNTDLFVCSADYSPSGDISSFRNVNAPVVNYLGDDYYTFNSDFSHWVKVSDIVAPDERQSDMYIFQIGDSITCFKDNKLNDDPVTNPNTYKGHGFMRYVCEQMNIPASHHFPRGFSGISVCGYANYLNSNPDAFPKSTTDMSKVIWVVELGTNDWGASFNEPLGTKSDYINNTGYNTMYGALRIIVDYMVEDIDNENVVKKRPKVVMLTPMDRGAYSNSTEESWRPCSFQYDENGDLKFTPNNTGATINDYADAIRWVCEREGFTCVDFIENPICPRKYMNLALTFESCVMKPTDDKKPEVYQDIYGDNLHPTDKGDIIMGRLIYQKIMQFFYDSNI